MKKKSIFLGGIALVLVSLFGFYTYMTMNYHTSVCRKCMLQKTETWLYDKVVVRTEYYGTLVHNAFFKLSAYDHPCRHEWVGVLSGGPCIRGGPARPLLVNANSIDAVVFLAIIERFFPQEKDLWFSRLGNPEFRSVAGFISLDDESLRKWHEGVLLDYETLKDSIPRKKP